MTRRHTAPLPPSAWSLGLLASLLLGACSEPEVEPCVIEPRPDGLQAIRCPDGSSGVLIPPEFPAAPASVRGNVRRLGDRDNSGIAVTLTPARDGGEVRNTFTDAQGDFVFEDVEPGTYRVAFDYPAYPTVRLWQQTILPGTLVLDPVVMRPTTRIARTDPEGLLVSPNDDALLIVESTAGGSLLYWDENVGTEALAIGARTARPRWLPSGRVLFLENYDPASNSGTLVLFDPSRGTSEALLREVIDWAVSEDETVVVARQTQGALSAWSAVDRKVDVIIGSGLSVWDFHPGSKLVAAIFQGAQTGGPEGLVWDTVARQASMLGPVDSADMRFDPQGRFLLYRGASGYVLWDRLRRQPRLVAPGVAGTVEFAPTGAFVALYDKSGGIHLYEPETGQLRTLPGDAVQHGFDPRTGAFWFFHDGRRRLSIVPPGGDPLEIHRWSVAVFLLQVLFPRDRDEILYVIRLPSQIRELWRWNPAEPEPVQVDSGLTTEALLVAGDTHVLYEAERPRLFDLARGGRLDLRQDGELDPGQSGKLQRHVGHHSNGLLHYPIAPLYRVAPANTVGPMAIRDLATGSEHVIADELWHESCAFSAAGELFCLNRQSSWHPWGAELVRWDGEASLLRRLLDGVIGFGFDRDGGRAVIHSQAMGDELAPMLWLWERGMEAPVAIDDGVGFAVSTSRWVAYHVTEGSRGGVYVSTYPRIAPWFLP